MFNVNWRIQRPTHRLGILQALHTARDFSGDLTVVCRHPYDQKNATKHVQEQYKQSSKKMARRLPGRTYKISLMISICRKCLVAKGAHRRRWQVRGSMFGLSTAEIQAHRSQFVSCDVQRDRLDADPLAAPAAG